MNFLATRRPDDPKPPEILGEDADGVGLALHPVNAASSQPTVVTVHLSALIPPNKAAGLVGGIPPVPGNRSLRRCRAAGTHQPMKARQGVST